MTEILFFNRTKFENVWKIYINNFKFLEEKFNRFILDSLFIYLFVAIFFIALYRYISKDKRLNYFI